MKKSILSLVLFIGFGLLLSGCASSGFTSSSHITNVQLSTPNFHMVETNISGQSSSKALLGLSFGIGVASSQLALIPLTEDRMLYKNAMQKLWKNFEQKNGPVKDRRLALTNLRYDSESVNLFLYTKITTVIIADVIEFDPE